MRRPIILCGLLTAISLAASGCVVVSGNKAEIAPGGLMAACGSGAPSGVRRELLNDATAGFERLERIDVICADDHNGRVLIKVAGLREGGGHGQRTFAVRGDRLEPIS